MKNVKVLASIAALATVSCMAAATASAASSIKFELDAAKSNDTTKYVNMILETDEIKTLQDYFLTMELPDNVSGTSAWGKAVNISDGVIDAAGDPLDIVDNKIKLVEFKVEGESFAMSTCFDADWDAITEDGGNTVDLSACEADKIAVVNATEFGSYTDGEGVAVKAFTAKAAVDGKYTWNVTDGTNAAKSASTDVTGGADVVIGLTVAGANAGNITYAAVTID